MSDVTNPNVFEVEIEKALKVRAELNVLFDELFLKIKKGQLISHADYYDIAEKSVALQGHVFCLSKDSYPPQKTALPENVDPTPPILRASPFQKFVDECLVEYVKKEGLSAELLAGEKVSFHFRYSEVNREYRSGYEEVDIPEALLKEHHFEVTDYVKDMMWQEGPANWIETETDDSETADSDLTVEEA